MLKLIYATLRFACFARLLRALLRCTRLGSTCFAPAWLCYAALCFASLCFACFALLSVSLTRLRLTTLGLLRSAPLRSALLCAAPPALWFAAPFASAYVRLLCARVLAWPGSWSDETRSIVEPHPTSKRVCSRRSSARRESCLAESSRPTLPASGRPSKS
jgi:hypothetical protein